MDNLLRLEKTKAIDKIGEETHPRVIILFESYADREYVEESDINIFVESKVLSENIHESKKIIGLSRKINMYSTKSLDKAPIRLKRNLLNGIVLRG